MANMPDTNNRNLCVRVPRHLYYKVKRAADVVLFFLRSGCKAPRKGGKHETKAGGRK